MVANVECGGLETDKFDNLLYIDKREEAIMRIKSNDLKIFADSYDGSEPHTSHVPSHRLYSTETTVTAKNLEDLTIEKEYLYWTNSATNG